MVWCPVWRWVFLECLKCYLCLGLKCLHQNSWVIFTKKGFGVDIQFSVCCCEQSVVKDGVIAKAKPLNLETFGFYHPIKGGGCMWERLMPIKTMNLWQGSYLKNSFLGNSFILHTCYLWDNSFFLSKHPHDRKYLFVFSLSVSARKKGYKKLINSEYFPFLLTCFFLLQLFSIPKRNARKFIMSALQLSSWYWWESTFKGWQVVYCLWKCFMIGKCHRTCF